MTAPSAPVASLADEEAWRAREAYPGIAGAGGPIFGVAREREDGGWELHPYFSGTWPQDARDSMGSHFRKRAQEAKQAGDHAAVEEYTGAAERLDREVIDEMTVGGDRYKVVRAEPFIRTGPDGPEGPRPSDPDPAAPGEADEIPDPTAGFVIDTTVATGPSEGILKAELLALAPVKGTAPPDIRDDAVKAMRTHPGGVLLPPTFMTAEKIDGRWAPDSTGTSTTPQAARDSLAVHLRVMAPMTQHLNAAQRAEYARAADRLDEERGTDLEFAGRHLRIVRVERLVRIGPDGPEGSRPSDPDPQPPILVQEERDRAAGLIPDDDERPDPQVTANVLEFQRLWQQEQERRERRERGGGKGKPG